MFLIVDLETDPISILPNLDFSTEQEACEWIDQNGNAVKYTLIEI